MQPSTTNGNAGAAAYGSGNAEVIDLESAIPGINGTNSTSAQDLANAVQQSLQALAPDLHITPLANSSTIILTGNPNSIRLAKDLIARLDRRQPLVVLDTEVLEVSESAARNVGLEFPVATVQSTFGEIQPSPNPFTGQPGRLIGLQPLTRTGLQFTATLNFLVQNGNARVLADPRIATLSGHTASIRAGDTINILTQTGGGIGTPITQQLQTFNTGVSLDITPMVGPSGDVTVSLHPVVNSLEGLINGLPQIATRDTQTLVQLHDNDTLIIGGLIQETESRQVSKLPLLGDIPLVGKLFQNSNTQDQRNELVIVVTPHIIKAGAPLPPPDAAMPLPTAQPLPTLPPDMRLPKGQPTPVPRAQPIPITVATPTPLPPSPAPTPSAFANTNVFAFGSAPANTYAAESAAPQIFFAQLSPTVLHGGTPIQVSAVTTSNVKRVVLSYSSYSTTLSQVAPSRWQAFFNFNSGSYSPNQTVQITLTAYNAFGSTSVIQIPVSVAP